LKDRPPASDLFGVKGRRWLSERQLVLCERETVDRSPPGEYRLACRRRTLGSKVLFPRAASFQRITGRPDMDQHVIAPGDGHLSTKPEPRVLLELCNEMVRIYKEIFGRGPTRARADWAGRDAVLCTLEDTLTRAERKMVEVGDHQRLQETRMFFQHVCKDDFRASVERITGRKVRAFVSGIDTDTDVASEVFYLERPAD
jgi:uncharacterized protein YbcI